MWDLLLYIVFISAVFLLYWFAAKNIQKLQNVILLFASILFYTYLDWRFTALILGQTALTFFLANKYDQTKKKYLITTGVILNLGILLFYKYFNFFIDSFQEFFKSADSLAIKVALPVGISFYTFRLVGYLLDVKNKKASAEDNPIIFGTYSMFFPSVIMGPIDTAKALIPQFKKARTFKYDTAATGLRQILYGIFSKYVIGNSIAVFTGEVFADYKNQDGSTLLLTLFLYFIQLYADFAGYSNIALGIARLFGIEIAKNFNYPIFAQNIADFWRKWHMSLTTWFTNHLFMPLVIFFRDYGKFGLILAILINFSIIGLWHGAAWNFLLFGILHGLFYVPLILFGNINKQYNYKKLDSINLKWILNVVITTLLFILSLTFFISKDMEMVTGIFGRIFSTSLFTMPVLKYKLIFFCAIIYIVEFLSKKKEFPLEFRSEKSFVRHAVYIVVLSFIIIYGLFNGSQFIYQQF